jgi:NADH-quinone oxidoreductase subunit E
MNEILKQFRPDHREDLIPCLQAFQDKEGYISEAMMQEIGAWFGLPAIKLYGIATFYDYFTFAPLSGDVVKICSGTSCHMSGSGRLINEAEKLMLQNSGKGNFRFKLRQCECQGACSAGPVLMMNEKSFSRVKPEEVRLLIERNLSKGKGGQE